MTDKVAVGANVLNNRGHPFAPTGVMMQVREEFRAHVMQLLGEAYAISLLAVRDSVGKVKRYAPVVIGPGNELCFIWPSVEMDERWLEPAA